MSGSRSAVLCVLIVALAAPAHFGKEPLLAGDRLEFHLSDLDGRPITASDPRFRGKVVLVSLWATWCPPCISEIPTLIDLRSRLGGQGLEVVGIAFEREKNTAARREKLRVFAREHDINYLLVDGGHVSGLDKALPGLRRVKGFPVEILIDRDGRVVVTRHGYGYKKRWARRLEAQIEGLLAAR